MLTNGVRDSHVPHRALRSYGPSAKGAFLRNGLPPHALLSCFRQNALWAYRTLEGPQMQPAARVGPRAAVPPAAVEGEPLHTTQPTQTVPWRADAVLITGKGDKHVDHEYQQHRLARIEGYNITRARLQVQFGSGTTDPAELEKAIAAHLSAPSVKIAAWRRSEMEQAGYQEGVRLAALEFYWEHRQAAHPKELNPELHHEARF